jgi:hypothetical protein
MGLSQETKTNTLIMGVKECQKACRCTANEERHADKTVRGSSGEKNVYLWAIYSHKYITMMKVVHFPHRHSGEIKKDLSCHDGMTTRNEHDFCRHTWM